MLEVSPLHILWVYSVLEFLNCLSQQTPVFPRVGYRGLLCVALVWRLYGAVEGLRAGGFGGLVAAGFQGGRKRG